MNIVLESLETTLTNVKELIRREMVTIEEYRNQMKSIEETLKQRDGFLKRQCNNQRKLEIAIEQIIKQGE